MSDISQTALDVLSYIAEDRGGEMYSDDLAREIAHALGLEVRAVDAAMTELIADGSLRPINAVLH